MQQQENGASTNILSPWQGKLVGWFLVGLILFLGHSLLLQMSPPLSAWYLWNFLIHILWGLLLACLFVIFVLAHLWKTLRRQYWKTKLLSILRGILVFSLLAIAFGGGVWLTFVENRPGPGDSPCCGCAAGSSGLSQPPGSG